jgi:hypothetical protein
MEEKATLPRMETWAEKILKNHTPILSKTPASITLPAVGASV